MTLPDFTLFIGIDQTGAVLSGDPTRSKPLPCAHFSRISRDSQETWELRDGLSLPRLSREEVSALIREAGHSPARTALMVDCVFGLERGIPPLPAREPSDRLWARLSSTQSSPHYGRGPAQGFFSNLLGPGRKPGVYPRRECELHAKANSVFQTYPFQKNIQTGTFRIWKDLTQGSCERWLNFWPFETSRSRIPEAPWIFEGFPSLLWRDLLGLRIRDPGKLREALESRLRGLIQLRSADWGILGSHPDMADAAVLAAGGYLLQKERRLDEPFPGFRELCHPEEGWIAGLTLADPVSAPIQSAQAGKARPPRNARSKAPLHRPKRPG